jgi:exosortase
VPPNERSLNRPKYLSWGLVLLVLCLIPWKALISLSLSDEQYSHLAVVPLVAAVLICSERAAIFRDATYSPQSGIPAALTGFGLPVMTMALPSLTRGDYSLSLSTVLAVGIVAAEWRLCFGARAFRRAAFPLGFLLLMVPIPRPWMKPVILGLQHGSAEFSALLFRLIHLPALRQDLRFSLPGFDIEIAEQCSGIRSSIALTITSMLAAHLFLGTWWRKLALVLITIPLVVFKNAVRIVTISSLGVYVSRSFLFGTLHRYSGLPFSLLELAILAPLLLRWHRRDKAVLNEKI